MVRLTGPLFSQKAQKQLGKKVIYKTKGNRSFLTKYNKPGGVNPFDPSPKQVNKRMIYNLIIANWQIKTPAQKKVYDDLVTKKNLKMSGWNYFLREAMGDLPTNLGLQGYWAFNQIVDGKFLDLSGNENHGTPKPLYPSNYPNLANSINRKFGKAGNFDGIDDHVALPLLPNYTRGTISLWAKWAEVKDHQIIFWAGDDLANGYLGEDPEIHIGTAESSGKISWTFSSESGPAIGFSRETLIIPEIGKWYHIVFTWIKGTGADLYINGNNESHYAGEADFWLSGWDSAYLSRTGADISRNFSGLIDEVCVYNRVLAIEEIEKLYNLVP